MSKKLSIVIPYYVEKQTELFPLLSSIHNQIGADLSQTEVILVNDGSDNRLSQEFLDRFPKLDIQVTYLGKNGGPGVARQCGADLAEGDYILFCDADDILHSVGVIDAFLQEIEEEQPDIITSPWLEEIWDETAGRMVYLSHEDEATWMHGKVFKRAFLKTNNIRFHEQLRVHEDSYFLSIAFELTENKRKIPVTSYVWRWRDGSITRRNDGVYTYESIPLFHKAIAESLHELEQHGIKDHLPYKVVQMAAYTYFCTSRDQWLEEELTEYREAAEESFVESFRAFVDYFRSADELFIREVYNQERMRHFQGGMERESFNTWLDRIGFI